MYYGWLVVEHGNDGRGKPQRHVYWGVFNDEEEELKKEGLKKEIKENEEDNQFTIIENA